MSVSFRRTVSLCVCTAVAVLVCISNVEAQKPLRPDLAFLLIGEVNMVGQAEPDKELGDADPIPGVLLLNDEGKWEVAQHPLNRYSTIRQEDVRNQIGPGAFFAQRLHRSLPGTEIGLIVNARMNTTIASWNADAPLYQKTVRRVKSIRNLKLAGIIWLQGESDTFTKNYLEEMLKLIENFRTDFEEPELPFIVSEVHDIRSVVNEYNNRLSHHAKNVSVAPAKDLKVNNGTQLDRPSQVILGARLAEAWLGVAPPKFRPVTGE